MVVFLSCSAINLPFISTAKPKGSLKGRKTCRKMTHLLNLPNSQRCLPTLSLCPAAAVGHGAQLQLILKRRTTMICSAAMSVRCGGAEQTQTITREAPTITRAPSHINEKSPDLDDGGTGLPPRDDGDGGGGGGGDGGNYSGGFFFFGFLALLGLLKDNESDEE